MPDPVPMVDQRARDIAREATSGIDALKIMMIEREKADEKRWATERENEERRWTEARRYLETIQNTYRDSFTSLREETRRNLQDSRDSLAQALRSHAEETAKWQESHQNDDNEIHEKLQGRMWGAAWGLIAFLGTSVLALIGVIWTMLPHHP